MASNEDVQDLLKQIVDLKRENANLQAFVDDIRPHFLIWKCPQCPNTLMFTKESPPVNTIKCELCEIEMRPNSILKYQQLKDQYDTLDEKHSQSLAERNKYAKLIQDLIPVLQEYGYNPQDNNPLFFIKQQLMYLTMLEKKLTGEDEKKLE